MSEKIKALLTELLAIAVGSAVIGYLWSLLPGSNHGPAVGVFLALALTVIFFLYDDKPQLDWEIDRPLLIMSFVVEMAILILAVVINLALIVGLWALEWLFKTAIPLGTVADRIAITWIVFNLIVGFREFAIPLWKAIRRNGEESLVWTMLTSAVVTLILGLVALIVSTALALWGVKEGFDKLNLSAVAGIETPVTLALTVLFLTSGYFLAGQIKERSVCVGDLTMTVLVGVSDGLSIWAIVNTGSNPWVLAVPAAHLLLFLIALLVLEKNWLWEPREGRLLGTVHSYTGY